MDLFCRNSLCQYYSRPIQVKESVLKCPSCGTALLGGSVNTGPSVDRALASHSEPERKLLSPEPVSIKTHEKAAKDERGTRPRTAAAPVSPAHAGAMRDDPNMTRPSTGRCPV